MPAPASAALRCDGRKRCSQPTSCAEARHFLAHCPGVPIDGRRDRIACQDQLCRASAERHGRT